MGFSTTNAIQNISGNVSAVETKRIVTLYHTASAVTANTVLYTVPGGKKASLISASLACRLPTTGSAQIQVNTVAVLNNYVGAASETAVSNLSWQYGNSPTLTTGQEIRIFLPSGAAACLASIAIVEENA